MLYAIIFLVCGIVFVSSTCTDNKPLVTTPLGKIRGFYQNSYGNRNFSAFEGIPYAKPPTGDRRFEEPEPIEPWNGIWEATHRTLCAQNRRWPDINTTIGEEDCLYLNIYVPRTNPGPKHKLDVIVHIHGGAFILGYGHYANPDFLMDRDIVLVTFNYRLGIFGFLSTEDGMVPGNNGLKDQVMALRWVQTNIACFGGNPDSVTLTGSSAGGASVHLHFLSPMSKGLFHRGTSQSGVALNSFALQKGALKKEKLLAEAVGCPSRCSRAIVRCLKQRHYGQLASKMYLFYGYTFNPMAPFGPVVEKGPNPFLSKHPYELLKKGKFQDLPYIVSTVAHEGLVPVAHLDLEEVDEKWEDIASYLLDYNYTLPKDEWASTATKIRNFYEIGAYKLNNETLPKLIKLFGDRIFQVDCEVAIKLQAKFSKSPVYYYYFSYPGDHSPNMTVDHGIEGQYIFYRYRNNVLTANEAEMKEIMVDMLTSFAATGFPAMSGIYWEPTSDQQLTYLNISSHKREDIRLETTKELSPIKFWKSLGFHEGEALDCIKDEL